MTETTPQENEAVEKSEAVAPIDPETIRASKLPTAVHGYRREATDELLNRIATSLEEVVRERDALAETVAKLEQLRDDLESDKSLLRAEKKELEQELIRRHPAHVSRDEAARVLLVSAQKAARELREATRAECEAALKKAHEQAARIEDDALRGARDAAAELERLRRLQSEVRERLRWTLESMLREVSGANHREAPSLDDALVSRAADH